MIIWPRRQMIMAYRTAEQRAERDELVAGILAGAPSGITEYGIDRLVRARLGLRRHVGSGYGRASLWRLKAAGRARFEEEPHQCREGFRRVWYPVEERP